MAKRNSAVAVDGSWGSSLGRLRGQGRWGSSWATGEPAWTACALDIPGDERGVSLCMGNTVIM
jgi:hypothetical protein